MSAPVTSLVLAPLVGALFCLGFAPFDFWPLVPLTAAGLLALLNMTRRPMWCAWLFGLGKYSVGVSWVYVSIHVHGNASPALAGFLVAIFVCGMALFMLPLGGLYAKYRSQPLWSVRNVLWFSVLWMLIEWLLTWLLTGFPWLLAGTSMLHSPLQGWLPVMGVLGTSWWVVVSAAALLTAVFCKTRIRLVLLGLSPWVVGYLLINIQWVQPAADYQAALVQGNLEQARKWLPEERLPNVRKHMDLSRPHWDADLLVWPEAAVTMFPQQAPSLLENLQQQGVASQTNIVFGIPGVKQLPDERYEFQNLAMGLGLAEGQFAKHHLVPFGDYVPLQGLLRGLIEFFDLPMSAAVAGQADQAGIKLSFGRAAMAICYEVAYGESLRRQAADAAVLITVTNDTWFGRSIGPLQHMQIAQTRAAENGRWLLRAANNGVTAIVDHRGQLQDRLPQFEAGVLRGKFQVMQGRTPYSYVGDWPLLLTLFLLFVLQLGRRVSLRPRNDN